MSNLLRGLAAGAATLGVIGTGLGLYAAQPPEHPASTVVVEDTAGVLYEPTLRERLEDVRFYEPTDVAIFTYRGGLEARTDNYALNNAVRDYGKETRTEWMSDDGQKWADDLYIFAVDPEGRIVGTYFGENRKLDEASQLAIQDAIREDLRRGQWTEGAAVAVEQAADRMNAPFMRSAPGMALTALAGLLTVVGGAVWLGVGLYRSGRSRAARAEGDERMASVVRDFEVTELHARLIPEESRYGGLMLRRYDEYVQGFRELTDLGNEARSIAKSRYNSREALERLTAYRDKALAMDQLDDVIADTATLLNLDNAWPQVWEKQVQPLRTDLEGVEPVLREQIAVKARGVPEVQALRKYAGEGLAHLDQLRIKLETRALSPDDALDHLRTMRERLSQLLDELAAAVAAVVYKDEDERYAMISTMSRARREGQSEPTIIGTVYPTWAGFTVSSFRSSYDEGRTAVQSLSSSGGSGVGWVASRCWARRDSIRARSGGLV